MIEVRDATPADAAALAELRWEFRAGRDEPIESHDAFIERCAGWMRRELTFGDPWRAMVVIARDLPDCPIVGQVWIHVVQKVPNPVGDRERHIYLSNLYVQPASRGGTGTLLLQTVIAWARANGVDRILLWPTARSVPLYRRHGFTREGDLMELAC